MNDEYYLRIPGDNDHNLYIQLGVDSDHHVIWRYVGVCDATRMPLACAILASTYLVTTHYVDCYYVEA